MLRNVCKVESTKKYNSEDENHSYQEDLTEIDNPLKKRKVKLTSFSVILDLQQNKKFIDNFNNNNIFILNI